MAEQSRHTAIERIYGTDDLYSPRAVQAYLNQLRRADRAACAEIGDVAEMMEQVLSRSKGVPILMHVDTRWMARRVVEPLNEAANAHNAAANLAVLTWQRFHRHFGTVVDEARRSKGKSARRMDWGDA